MSDEPTFSMTNQHPLTRFSNRVGGLLERMHIKLPNTNLDEENIYKTAKRSTGLEDFGDEFFFFQHAPELQPNGNMVVFDNGNTRTPFQSRVVEIAFDDPLSPTDAWIVREDWLVDELGDPLFASFAGDGDRMDNGNTLVMAGAVRRVQEMDPDGRLLWSMSLWQGDESFRGYRAQRLPTVVKDTPGDRDGDWDLDLADLGGLQAAYGGAGLGFPDRLSDFNSDDELDAEDMTALVNWMTGPVE